ncbi:hypothetical protein MXB_1141 [Myxobolus squamalis]|nr:hypothetical protein MXB_1141 [Myxobolus squamalis]
MYIRPNNHSFIQFVHNNIGIQLICTNSNDLVWVSINHNDLLEKQFSKFLNYDFSITQSITLSYYNPLKILYDFFQTKPLSTSICISDIVGEYSQ